MQIEMSFSRRDMEIKLPGTREKPFGFIPVRPFIFAVIYTCNEAIYAGVHVLLIFPQ